MKIILKFQNHRFQYTESKSVQSGASIEYLKTKVFFKLPLLDLYLFGESVQRVFGVGGFEVAENFGLDNV